jgi:8-oxo-dGTP pyrophosphatase MutT (NUDIX family)
MESIKKQVRLFLENVNSVKHAAGVLILCSKTNKVLLLLRNDKKPTWSCIAGGIKKGEPILKGLKREIVEETKLDPDKIEFEYVGDEFNEKDNTYFYYYHGFVDSELKLELDYENIEYKWCDFDLLPEPLYPKMKEKIKTIYGK